MAVSSVLPDTLPTKQKKRFIDSYLKSIYPESLGRAWTLGGPPVPPSLVRRSGSPDLLVRSNGEFSAVEGMSLESSLFKASQKSNTTERKKRQGQLRGGLGLPAKIPDDAYGADSNVCSRSLRQIGIGARSLLSGTLDGLSLGLAKPGTTLSDYLGLPKPEKGTPEELVSGLIRGRQIWRRLFTPGGHLRARSRSGAARRRISPPGGRSATGRLVQKTCAIVLLLVQEANINSMFKIIKRICKPSVDLLQVRIVHRKLKLL